MNNNVCSAVFLGHSFIRRLNEFMKDNPSYYNLRLYENLFDIRCRAQGGLTVFRLIHERYDLYDFGHFTPTIIYLQIGGNDLSKPGISSEKLVNDIVSFANYLHHGKGIPIVIVGELLWRHPHKVGDEYNPKVVDTNVLIRQKLTTGNKDNICMWRHRGFWTDFPHLDRDGVHLNDDGMKKYFRSIRSAIIHAKSTFDNASLVI